ncbi:MAG: WYL domain-containing protein [Lachnospiraceae bacterium]|nr:WYL domain-containing protein [Lachnospiraceae bacterium]
MKKHVEAAKLTADENFLADDEFSEYADMETEDPDPDPNLQLYILAIIQLYASEEAPISVKGIKDILDYIKIKDKKLKYSMSTIYSNLRTLREIFSADNAALWEAGSLRTKMPSTLAELYGGTIHCYEIATQEQKKKGFPDFIEVNLKAREKKKRERFLYAFRGRFSEGEIEMLKASVIANQYLSADTTERLLRELNSIRSAAQSERAYKDEKYFASLHQDDKLGQVIATVLPKIADHEKAATDDEDFMAARISLLLKAIHDRRKVRMTYGSYTLERVGSKSVSETVSEEASGKSSGNVSGKASGKSSGNVSGKTSGKSLGNATEKAADASFENLPRWRKKGYNLALQPDGSGTSLFSPFAVFCANGYYYLIAHAEGRGVYYRNYRIDRIVSLEMTEEKSEPMPEKLRKYAPEGSSFNAVEYRNEHPVMFGGAPSHYKLRCQKKMLNNLVDAFGTRFGVYMGQDAEAEDSYLVYVSASEEGIISFCLQYGEYCQVLDAPQVEEKLCAKLDAIRAKYLKKI